MAVEARGKSWVILTANDDEYTGQLNINCIILFNNSGAVVRTPTITNSAGTTIFTTTIPITSTLVIEFPGRGLRTNGIILTNIAGPAAANVDAFVYLN